MKLYERHGMSDSNDKSIKRLYTIWGHMKNRCSNETCSDYKNYGGRGIRICNEWIVFPNFYSWAITHNYSDDLTLDRINVNGNYCPENCRWATTKQQCNNTRFNRFLTYNNCTKTMQEWCDIFDLKIQVVYDRLRIGWSVERALTTPVRKKIKK